MAKDFLLVSQFYGYENKRDVTNMPAGFLVSGSQNMISTDGDRVAVRKGFSVYGATGSGTDAIRSSYEWSNHRGQQLALRAYGTKLQFLYSDAWYDLKTDFTSVEFNWAEFWDNVQKQDVLLFVNGTTNIFEWNGALATYASATANTITKQGTTTWAQEGFNSTGTVVIRGTTYTYTGGYATTTLTGVTPNPTLGGLVVSDLIYQPIKIVTPADMTSEPSFGIDLIATLYNQVYLGALDSREVYVSKINNYKDYSFTAGRLPGEGGLLTLDAAIVAFDPQEEYMSIHAGKDQIYKTVFTLSADQTKETLVVQRLKTSVQKAARSQSAIGKVINDTVFVSNEPTIDTLGRVEQITTPQTKPLSDAIKADLDLYNLTGVHVKYFKNNLYFALPAENKVLIRNLEKGWWETPQTLPVSRFAIINGVLYGHSSYINETYKLFDGRNDNGAPIRSIAAFSYLNFGTRTKFKNFTEWYTEGYISPNTDLSLVLNYEYGGFDQQLTKLIEGDDLDLIFSSVTDSSLGTHTLGEISLGGGGGIIEVLPPKFRAIRTQPPRDFYEMQPIYISEGVDQNFELLAFGPEVSETLIEAATIKQ